MNVKRRWLITCRATASSKDDNIEVNVIVHDTTRRKAEIKAMNTLRDKGYWSVEVIDSNSI